jgi:hypothetical protein
MRLKASLLALAIALSPALVHAQPAACDLPAGFAGWAQRGEVISAAQPAALPRAEIEVGRAAIADLHAAAEVAFVSPPKKPPAPASQGGMVSLTIDAPGVYAIALGAGAWLDVIKDGQSIASTTFSHGPACSDLHKIVDFPLQPGRYVVQISGSPDPRAAIMVARVPAP